MASELSVATLAELYKSATNAKDEQVKTLILEGVAHLGSAEAAEALGAEASAIVASEAKIAEAAGAEAVEAWVAEHAALEAGFVEAAEAMASEMVGVATAGEEAVEAGILEAGLI